MINYLVCTSSRSGSSFLAHTLQTYQLGFPQEPKREKEHHKDFQKMAHTSFSVSGDLIRAVKIKNHILSRDGYEWLWDKSIPMHYIYVERLDKTAQGISNYILDKTQQSTLFEASEAVDISGIEYDFDEIHKFVCRKHVYAIQWRKHFDKLGIAPLTFYYEELSENIESCVKQVAALLRLSVGKKKSKVPIKQRTQKTIELTKRYKFDCIERGIFL